MSLSAGLKSTVYGSPVGICLLKVNNRNTRTRCEMFNFKHISQLALVFLLLTLNMQLPAVSELTLRNNKKGKEVNLTCNG